MEISPADEFVDRLISEEAYAEPADDCKVSELDIHLPPWYDENKFRAGQKFYRDNIFGATGGQVLGLATIIAIPTILQVLVHTKKSSSSYTAYRRYVSTNLHAMSWNYEELKPGSKSWNSILAVRTRHLKVGKNVRTLGIGNISQRDVALTQFGFVGHIMLFPDYLGILSLNKDGWEGFNHLWRTLMYMIGLKDEYNLCSGTVEETTQICRILMDRVFSPLLEFPPEPFEHMAYVIFDGLSSLLPLLDPKVGLYTLRYLAGIPGYVYTEQDLKEFRRKLKYGEIEKHPKSASLAGHETRPRPDYNIENFYLLSDVPEYKKLSMLEAFKLHTTIFLTKLYCTYIGKICLNGFIYFLIFLSEHFPILGFIRFGISKSWVNMFEESISDKTKPLSNAEIRRIMNEPPWYARWNVFHAMKAQST